MNTLCHIIILTAVFLIFVPLSLAQPIDYGKLGVPDGAPVDNIVQLTTGTEERANLFHLADSDDEQTVQPWSKDGNWIAFSSEVGGTGRNFVEIAVMKIDGSSFSPLTDNSIFDIPAGFSTDGWVYYSKATYDNGYLEPAGAFRVNGNGSSMEEDLGPDDTKTYWNPLPSPDGSKIAYTVLDNFDYTLHVANSDGSSPMKVSGKRADGTTDISVRVGQYSWSSDSQFLVYAGYGDTNGLFKVAVDDENAATIIEVPLYAAASIPLTSVHAPAWSPDGRKIAFYTLYFPDPFTDTTTLCYISADGTGYQELDQTSNTQTPKAYRYINAPISWRQDSTWLSYSKLYYDPDATPSYTNEVFIAQADSSDLTQPIQLTKGYTDAAQAFAPNGFQMVFQSLGWYSSFASHGSATREGGQSCTTTNSCTDRGDIMLLNLSNDFAKPVPPAVPSASDGEFRDKVRISWDGVLGATSYEVWRSTSSSDTGESLGTVSGTSYDDTSASHGKTFYYSLKGCNVKGCSANSPQDMGSLKPFPWPMFLPAISAQP